MIGFKSVDSRNFLIDGATQNEKNSTLTVIKDALYAISQQNTDSVVRNVVAHKVAQKFVEEVSFGFFVWRKD